MKMDFDDCGLSLLFLSSPIQRVLFVVEMPQRRLRGRPVKWPFRLLAAEENAAVLSSRQLTICIITTVLHKETRHFNQFPNLSVAVNEVWRLGEVDEEKEEEASNQVYGCLMCLCA